MAVAAQTAAPPPVTAADRVLGRADAPVTVIEYASFVCSHCADWHTGVYPGFKARFVDTGQVRLVFRNFPTQPVQVGARAAGIARCAAPARFFDVASSFMKGQAALIDGGPIGTWFGDAVAVSGKTQAEIDACLADPATLAGIRAEVEGAQAAGVPGTPAFFVNGRRVSDNSLEGLAAAIQPLLPRS
ncbi:MAG: DsbA family protein [Alphaproteobacteria bacterium]|nr:DsbA family protein [Alphaproteobacteria bacterium]MBU1539926.1 DsbA family protein [Alphaproteobacteria bacterium]MBU2380118.1 DsbA family protein [Alphaproteobacteria bacterium]